MNTIGYSGHKRKVSPIDFRVEINKVSHIDPISMELNNSSRQGDYSKTIVHGSILSQN